MTKSTRKKGHRDGKNVKGKHTTLTEATEEVLRKLEREFGELCIKFGRIDPGRGRGGEIHIKIFERNDGLKLRILGRGAEQDLWIYDKEVLDDGIMRKHLMAQTLLCWYEPNCVWISTLYQQAARLGLVSGL
jgi:hypothetical protein